MSEQRQDIVTEHLRTEADVMRRGHYFSGEKALRNAADEIDRLRADLALLGAECRALLVGYDALCGNDYTLLDGEGEFNYGHAINIDEAVAAVNASPTARAAVEGSKPHGT